jgi:hypothetical protein
MIITAITPHQAAEDYQDFYLDFNPCNVCNLRIDLEHSALSLELPLYQLSAMS